jgi:hypothetical protein
VDRRIAVEDYTDRLTIVVPWRRSVRHLVKWTLLGVVACLFLGVIAAGLIIDKKDPPIGGILFCALPIVVVSSCLLAYWLNRTTIDVTRQSIAVHHGPIRCPRSPSFAIDCDDIDQVYVQTLREVQGVTYHGAPASVSYQVCVLLNTRDRIRLFNCGYAMRLPTEAAKAFAERLKENIAGFLLIEDRPVDGAEVTVVVPPPTGTAMADGP